MNHHAPFLLPNKICNILNINEVEDTLTHFRGFSESSNSFFIIVQMGIKNKKDGNWHFTLLSFQYDKEFQFVNCKYNNDFEKDVESAMSSDESSIMNLPSGELIYSTTHNRTYFFDDVFNAVTKKCNLKLQAGWGEDHSPELIVKDSQELFDNNLFYKAAICPDTNLIMALFDVDTSRKYTDRKMRGDFFAISQKPVLNSKEELNFKFIRVINHTLYGIGDGLYKKVQLENGEFFSKKNWKNKESVTQLLKISDTLDNCWSSGPIALGKGLFLIPIFQEMHRSGSRGNIIEAAIIDSNGEFLSRLNGLDYYDDSPYEKKNFNFVAFPKKRKIFYKNAYGIYLFNYQGDCIEKHYFASNSNVKPLKPYKLIGGTSNSKAILYHEKNNDILIINYHSKTSLEDSVVTSIKAFKKEKSFNKKQYLYRGKCWFESEIN